MMFADFSPNPEAPVLVIGAAGVDLVGRLQSELKPGTSTPAFIRTTFGGVARNVAENLARLGQPVTLITAVGDDEPGHQLLKQVEEAGVDTSRVLCCQDQSTGSYLAVINRAAELSFALDDMRVIHFLTSDYLKQHQEVFKNASLLFLDMNLDPKTLRTAISLARRYHLPVFADPTSVSLAKRLLPYLDQIAFLTPNSKEAEVLCGMRVDPENRTHALEAASCLVSKGVKIAVLTLSEFGLCYATPESRGYIPAISTEIVDPTGAGDALTAAVIVSLLDGIPLDEAMRLGVAAASLTLRYRGAVCPDLSLEILYEHLVV
jgi:pseudouridine kinase